MSARPPHRRTSTLGALGALAAFAALLGCTRRDDSPVRVVVIGNTPHVVDASQRPLTAADAILTGATAQGLVRLDAGGQIVPGLAERWNVSDDGLSYIFRVGDHRWPDGARVTARFIVRQLRAAVAPASRNPLKTVLTGIVEIDATNEVIEIRLAAPRPNLLQHLARPELAIVRQSAGGAGGAGGGRGAGPFRIAPDKHDHIRLLRSVPAGDTDREETVLLSSARAALAVALFLEGEADLVLGGTANDLPVVRAADPPDAALRIDPAVGLFGLAVVDVSGPLASPDLRRALAMSIDRDSLVTAIGVDGLQPRTSLTAPGLSNLLAPAVPGWAAAPLPQRQAEARRLVAASAPAARQIRVAIPTGPGYRVVFAHLKRDWATVGIDAVRVDLARSADLRLIDEVAPSRGASWYLERFTCARAPVCDQQADAALAAARIAQNPAERAARFAEADRRLSDATVFVPLTAPVRWWLVARRITGFRANPFAVHSLADLFGDRGG